MGCIVTHDEGPVTVAAAGYFIFYYTHPYDKPPTMIDMVSAELTTGTGARGALYIVRSGLTHLIQIFQLTDTDRVMTWTDNFLLKPGETIKVMISNLAAADTVQWMVNGH